MKSKIPFNEDDVSFQKSKPSPQLRSALHSKSYVKFDNHDEGLEWLIISTDEH
jgi:hypothetical protein